MQVVMASHLHLSKAELRKSNKPIMEKRRRARINNCLDELKSLILEAMKKDPSRHAKLEKADILEMTVKHLQDLQRTQMRTAVAADPSVLTKFQSGFNECANEVTRYVSSIDGVEDGVRRRLMGHLTGCMTGLSQVLPLARQTSGQQQPSPGDVNNNTGRLQILSGLSPPGLATPLSATSPAPITSPRLLPPSPAHRSAFSAVQRCSPPTSPLSDTSDCPQDLHLQERHVPSPELHLQVPEPRQELRVHIAEPRRHDFLLSTSRQDGLLMEAPRPAPAQTDVWRPW